MYQNAKLKNSYTFAYVMWLFGIVIIPLLFIKIHLALVIVLEVLAVLDLAALITSHVFYLKDYKLFSLIGLGAVGAFDLLTVLGLVFELVMVCLGKNGGGYIWFILILTIASGALLSVFFALDYKKHQEDAKKLTQGE